MLDTGGHQATIESLGFTPNGRFIVSSGDDKVIRVWDWRAGKTVRTIRGQSAPGPFGTIYTMAVSPDGRWLAVGGYLHPACVALTPDGGWVASGAERCGEIRLFDLASGKLLTLLKGHLHLMQRLAFSSDGKRLISGSSDRDAIIWDVEKGTILQRLHGHSADVLAVAFSPNDALAATASFDKTLRLWRVADGTLVKEMKGHRDQVSEVAFSPRDGSIVSGDWSGEIRLWDGKTGEFQRVLASQDGDVERLRFSPDGHLLLACGRRSKVQRIYDASSGAVLASYAKLGTVVFGCAFSPDGSLVATGGGPDNEIHVWDPATGETKAVLKGAGQSIRAVGFSPHGHSIAWGTTEDYHGHNNRGTLEMALRLPAPGEAISQPEPVKSQENWVRANANFGAQSLQIRKGEACHGGDMFLDVMENGKPAGVSLERSPYDGCQHRSYSFTPDGKTIVTGGDTGNLIAYGPDGKKTGDFRGHEGDVLAITPSPDGRYLLSGSSDQTLRLWNLKTRELLVTLFRGADGEWVMWTPQGYYTGSPGADKIVGWQINKGWDNAADYVTAEQLRKHLNRPDIVAKAIQLASAEEAVRTSYGTEFKLSNLLARPAPHLRILSPAPGGILKTPGIVTVRIVLDRTPDPVTRIRVQVNGRQLDDFLPENGPSFAPGEHEFEVPLAKGKNTIVVTALNEIGWSKVQDGTLTLENESAGLLDKDGTLYILAVGVSKYPGIAKLCKPNPSCDLTYTGADAKGFADIVEQRVGALHNRVERRVLVNGGSKEDEPTAANIIDALGKLAEAQPNDTVAVFLSGHGMNEGPNYRFVPTDASVLKNGTLRPSSVVPWYAIEEAIDGAKGRRLLFVDTCHSAGAYNDRLGNSAYYANILAYSSARWDQVAWESAQFGHGFFTEAIVEGLSGAADSKKDGRVDTVQLYGYLQKRVGELAKGIGKEQEPQFFKGRDAEISLLAEFN
jgi:WD40 repeat protein